MRLAAVAWVGFWVMALFFLNLGNALRTAPPTPAEHRQFMLMCGAMVVEIAGGCALFFLKNWGRRLVISVSILFVAIWIMKELLPYPHVYKPITFWETAPLAMLLGYPILLLLPSVKAAFHARR